MNRAEDSFMLARKRNRPLAPATASTQDRARCATRERMAEMVKSQSTGPPIRFVGISVEKGFFRAANRGVAAHIARGVIRHVSAGVAVLFPLWVQTRAFGQRRDMVNVYGLCL